MLKNICVIASGGFFEELGFTSTLFNLSYTHEINIMFILAAFHLYPWSGSELAGIAVMLPVITAICERGLSKRAFGTELKNIR